MGLDIKGPTKQLTLEFTDRTLFDLQDGFGLYAPECDKLWDSFYDNPNISSVKQVRQLQTELEDFYERLASEKRSVLIREKKIRAKDPQVVEAIVGPFLTSDFQLIKLRTFIEICSEAIAAGVGLECHSD